MSSFFLISLVLLLGSCAPLIPLSNYSDPTALRATNPVIVEFDIQGQGFVSDVECDLTLDSLDGTHFKMPTVHAGYQVVVVDLPPGNYRLKSLNCNQSLFDVGQAPHFTTVANRPNYVGLLELRPKKLEELSYQFKSGTMANLRSIMQRYRYSELYSPYVGRAISLTAVEATTHVSYHYTRHPQLERIAKQIDYKSCLNQELEKNPLRVGNLVITIRGKDGQMTHFNDNEMGQHLYSETFVECITDMIKRQNFNNIALPQFEFSARY